jgi:REP element-mobilizing transposase RayT/Mor family transcriptional regulator
MPRAERIDHSGYYHLSNRGVGLREVFLSNEDRIFFITLMCNSARHYEFSIHGYALISNGYNLLIETSKNNLSHIMKLINGQYTSYFNRRYKRRGHLWEGRFKSWRIEDKGFILDILAYIEHLPVYTGSATEKQHYSYSTYRQFIGIDERLPCLHNSIVFQQFNTLSQIKAFFSKPVDIERINSIHQRLKKESRKKPKRPKKALRTLALSDLEDITKQERDKKIYKAYKAGHSQAKIGSTLGISQQAVYKIIKRISEQ